MRSSGACSGSDLTEATRQRRRPTFNTAAILSVGLNDSLNGADVSHLEVLCDFLQVQSPEIPILAIWEIFGAMSHTDSAICGGRSRPNFTRMVNYSSVVSSAAWHGYKTEHDQLTNYPTTNDIHP